MREQIGFSYYEVAPSLDPTIGDTEAIACFDSQGGRAAGYDKYEILSRTHKILLKKRSATPRAAAKLKKYADWVSDFEDFPYEPYQEPPSGLFALSIPLRFIKFLIEHGSIGEDEYVAILDTEGEAVAGVLNPRTKCEAVAPVGKKKNPNRRVLVPASPPGADLFVLRQANKSPLVVSASLKTVLNRKFGGAISFFGVGQAA